MRRRVIIGLILSLLVLITASLLHPSASRAGDGYYSPSGCDGGARYTEGGWWGVPGQGTYYFSFQYGGWYWVGSTWYQIYAENDWECGVFGWPWSNAYDVGAGDQGHAPNPLFRPGEWYRQDFERTSMNYYHGHWYFCDNRTGACSGG